MFEEHTVIEEEGGPDTVSTSVSGGIKGHNTAHCILTYYLVPLMYYSPILHWTGGVGEVVLYQRGPYYMVYWWLITREHDNGMSDNGGGDKTHPPPNRTAFQHSLPKNRNVDRQTRFYILQGLWQRFVR